MRDGDFTAAWALSDAVLRARAGETPYHLPRHLQWCWDGRPLGGRRVLVHCHHGLGDTIQFVRYLPLLQAIGAHVTLRAQPALHALLATARGIDALLPLHDGPADCPRDVDVEIMELPHVFRTTVATIPARLPYLHVAPVPRARDGTLHVGLVWAAGDWAPERSMHVDDVAPLLALPGVTWHVLQRGAPLAQCDPAHRPREASDDVLDSARTIAALDLVITVDSMPAHLAGALGVRTWTLLPHHADWRWMRGPRTPWYPTMRLVRQRTPGDWASVIARVRRALVRRATMPRGSGATRDRSIT